MIDVEVLNDSVLQVRTYVMDPYKLVKDYVTGISRQDIENVLDGDLDEFMRERLVCLNGH